MRVRASKGLRMTSFHGNFFVRSTDLLAMPAVPRDQGYVIEVGIEENINSNVVCLQTAVLHTTCYGERRIRVLTLCLPVTNSLADMYASADQVAIAALLANKSMYCLFYFCQRCVLVFTSNIPCTWKSKSRGTLLGVKTRRWP